MDTGKSLPELVNNPGKLTWFFLQLFLEKMASHLLSFFILTLMMNITYN